MITYHYDVCILADSPATYLCARILTKKGLKVLLCENKRNSNENFKSFQPFFVSKEGPLISLMQLTGVKLELPFFSLQIVLPEGRAEIGRSNLDRELQWLFGDDYDRERGIIEHLNKLSKDIKGRFFSRIDEEISPVKRLKKWLLERRLSKEVFKTIQICSGGLHGFIISPISFPFFRNHSLIPSPFYASIWNGEAHRISEHISSLGEILLKDIGEEMDRVPLSEIQVDNGFRFLKIGEEMVTFKFLIFDTTVAKEIYQENLSRRISKIFETAGFWFPLQVVLKKEGLPVGMGRDVIMLNPAEPECWSNLIYLNRVDEADDKFLLNVYSLWQKEIPKHTGWQEEIVGNVMDRIIELMPFVNRHIVQLSYPEKVEDIPAFFYNSVYLLKKKFKLFSPAIKYKLKKNVFLCGYELFPQWGIDSYGISAWFVTNKIMRKLGSTQTT